MTNRYIKGRLPEGVDFAAYPGRSSTPLPTAESKSAERINQLKIWNEAATNDDRRLGAGKTLGVNVATVSATRRTDSFKQAKDRHSASFHATLPTSNPSADSERRANIRHASIPLNRNKEIFADRSDSESDDEPLEHALDSPIPSPHQPPHPQQPATRPQTTSRPVSVPPARPSNPYPTADNPHPRPVSAPPAQNNMSPPEAFPPARQPKSKNACCIIM
ncbi:hypothetical protein BWQ96_02972 [Gracilariopsis chorda]|uniref:Uncharacterized protein n=1 Tax=Gracilariopsis chorda TaxID=448386 RepID=A0A2V3IZT7_9FLOR|nr:hypothetical protein BWQ96_02972 [Gracilariopsis chorda]|eukprot:PXF47197.1 hypothetical protein BWQ96_02972 [Gracilariopsis chorda]